MTARTTLPAEAGSAAVARRFVADVLLQRGFPDGSIADAVLLTSEVVTYAVGQGGSSISVQVAAEPRMGRVEVQVLDAEPATAPTGTSLPEAPSGARLLMLEAMSEAWGFDRDGTGPRVWFEIRS